VYGKPLGKAIDVQFGSFKRNGRIVNTAVQHMTKMYIAQFDYMVEEQIRKNAEEYGVKGRGTGDKARTASDVYASSFDITLKQVKEIERKLEEAFPAVASYYSQGSKSEAISSGIVVGKQKASAVRKPAFKAQVYFGKKISNFVEGNLEKTTASTSNAYGYMPLMQEAGVGGVVLLIHSLDAAIMTRVLSQMGVMNIHDAIITGVFDTQKGAKLLNEAFYEVMNNYSLMGAVADSAARTKRSYLAFLKTVKDPAEKERLSELYYAKEVRYYARKVGVITQAGYDSGKYPGAKELDPLDSMDENFALLQKTNGRVKTGRAKLLPTLQSWNNYFFNSGEHIVVDKDSFGSQTLDAEAFINSFSKHSQTVSKMNSIDVFNSMEDKGTVQPSPEHKTHLLEMLSSIVNKQLVDFSLHLNEAVGNESIGLTTLTDMYLQHRIDETQPEGSRILSMGTRMSSQEVLVHEMVHNITAKFLNVGGTNQRAITRLWRLAKAKLKPEDFIEDQTLVPTDVEYAAQLEAAQARYDHMFRPETAIDPRTGAPVVGDGSSKHLHEFVAFGLTNQRMKTLLASDKLNAGSVKEAWLGKTTLYEKMKAVFDTLLEIINDRLINSTNVSKDKQLEALVKDMLNIELRHKNGVLTALSNGSNVLTEGMGKLIGAVSIPMQKWANSQRVKDAKPGLISIGGKAVRILEANQPEAFRAVTNKARDAMQSGKYGLIQELITELQGMTKENVKMHELNRYSNKMVDQARKHMSTIVKNVVSSAYDPLNPLTTATKAALTKVVLKTDLSSLMNDFTLDEMKQMMVDPAFLNKSIRDIQVRLKKSKHHNFYRRSARSLGYLMVVGQPIEDVTNVNAYNIARLAGTSRPMVGNLNADSITGIEKDIDMLATLYALSFSAKAQKKLVADLITSEQARASTDKSDGFVTTLALHQDLKEQAKLYNFQGNPESFVKGHIAQITNPRIALKVTTKALGMELLDQGYTRLEKRVKRDPKDPVQDDLYIYVNRDGAPSTYSAGTFSLTEKHARGADVLQIQEQLGVNNGATVATLHNARIKQSKAKAGDAMFQSGEAPIDPTRNLMVPIIGKDMESNGYRYMMEEDTRDSLLERHNDFDAIMGAMAGNIIDKVNSATVNKKTVEALYDQYKTDYSKHSNIYVRVGPTSTDKAMRERWLMLPEETKREVNRVWGPNGMVIRKDLVPLIFGQRKPSIFDMYNKDAEDLNRIEKMAVKFTTQYFAGAHLPTKLRKFEAIVKEVVKEGKDFIVVKTGTVTAANFASNSLLLKMLGVSMKDIVNLQWEATNGLLRYQKDKLELDSLRQTLVVDKQDIAGRSRLSTTVTRKTESRIAELEHDLAKNPVHELVDAGVLQSIIEDIEGEENTYSYKTDLDKKIEAKTDWVPAPIKTAARTLYMAHDTPLYKVMNNAVRMSDFVARYALHKHFTTRANNPLSKEDSINKVVDIFINYDIPTSTVLQYGNDVGLLWFTKYTIRVQKVIWEVLKDNPSSTLVTLILNSFFGDLSVIMDSAVPFNKGVFDVVGSPLMGASAAGDILTMNALGSAW